MSEKQCKACNQVLPLTQFYRSPAYKDGYVLKCKACTRLYDKKLCSIPKHAPSSGVKKCCRCKERKPISDFHKRNRNSDGLRSECIACTRVQEHAYRNRNPDVGYLNKVKHNYGLTKAHLEAMIIAQDGRCAICGIDDEKLVVDHSHASGRIRGMLCAKCNAGLGMFGDNKEYLLKAIEYLNNAEMVPATPS